MAVDRANAAESEWMGRVKRCRCVVCEHMGLTQDGPTFAHHRKDATSLRGGHYTTAALCYEHHQGASGIHALGSKGFYLRYKLDDWDIVELTIEAVFHAIREARRAYQEVLG